MSGWRELVGLYYDYTAMIDATSDGSVSASVAASTRADLAGNANGASDTFTVTVDNLPPVVAIDGAPASVAEATAVTLAGQASDPGQEDHATTLRRRVSCRGLQYPEIRIEEARGGNIQDDQDESGPTRPLRERMRALPGPQDSEGWGFGLI